MSASLLGNLVALKAGEDGLYDVEFQSIDSDLLLAKLGQNSEKDAIAILDSLDALPGIADRLVTRRDETS